MKCDIAEQILAMEQLCFSEPWQTVTLSEHSVYTVTEYGYALGNRCGNEYELLRIGVLPQFRRQGWGGVLMQEFLNKCGDGDVFLEVAARNAPAVALYVRCGFAECGRRRGYYSNDDAIVMKKSYEEA
jgi:ribosomal-protein-alanine N-acetyltransferase